jgi:hypothetical protein
MRECLFIGDNQSSQIDVYMYVYSNSCRMPVRIKLQEVLGRTNRLLSLIRHGPHWKRRVQQFFYYCVCIRYRGNVSTESLPSNDTGIFTEPLPSNDKGIFTEPLPSNDRKIYRHTHIEIATWSHNIIVQNIRYYKIIYRNCKRLRSRRCLVTSRYNNDKHHVTRFLCGQFQGCCLETTTIEGSRVFYAVCSGNNRKTV